MNPDNPLLVWSLETETNHWHVIKEWQKNPRVAHCGFAPKVDKEWRQHQQGQATDRCEGCLAVVTAA